MQINIDLLDLRTVDKAIKQIEQYQKSIQTELIPEFLKRCAETVRDMANNIISSLPYESEIISGLQNSWKTKATDGGKIVTLINEYDKAVYIEFGTGIVGSNQPHDEASESGYKYDFNAHGQEGWTFWLRGNAVDIPQSSILSKREHKDGSVEIRTAGAPATMFLYQAATNFIEYKVYKRVWKEFIGK